MQRLGAGRFAVIGTVNLLICLAFIHRYSLGSLFGASSILEDLGMTASQAGMLGSLYFLAYGVMQVPAGILTDRANPRWVLSLGTTTMVASILLFAAAPSYPVALLARLLLGIGMGPLFLPGLKLCAGWVGVRRYGTLVGAMVAWSTLTAPIALLLLPIPLASFGWRWTLVLLAVPLIPFIVLVLGLADGPAESAFAPTRATPTTLADLLADWQAVFQYRRFWTLVLGQLVWEGIHFAFLTWLPRYAVEALGQTPAASGVLPSLALVGFVAGAALAGWLTARLPGAGRIFFFGAAFLYAGLLGGIVVFYPVARSAPLLLPVVAVVMGLAMGNFTAAYVPIAATVPRHLLGTANGIYGAAAFFGGTIFPFVIGVIMDAVDRPTIVGATYSAAAYHTAFGVCAAILALVLTTAVLLDRLEPTPRPVGKPAAR